MPEKFCSPFTTRFNPICRAVAVGAGGGALGSLRGARAPPLREATVLLQRGSWLPTLVHVSPENSLHLRRNFSFKLETEKANTGVLFFF